MATNADIEEDDGEFVTLECIDPNGHAVESEPEGDDYQEDEEPIVVSTSDISSWDLTSILAHKSFQVKANRSRILGSSSYFRGLFCGNFSESCRNPVSIHWNMVSFLNILRVMFGCPVDLNSDNFIILHEAALFFGVEALLSQCHIWLSEVTSDRGILLPQLGLDVLIDIWKYGTEHANDWIPQLCISYLARNFMWASSCDSFLDVPYQLLYLCIQHPCLTVDSEKNLCDAILLWLAANIQQSGYMSTVEDGCTGMLQKIRCNLLPLWFLAGKRKCQFFGKFAEQSLDNVLRLAGHPSMSVQDILGDDNLSGMTIRLTEYSKKVDLSGCLQIRHILLSSLIPSLYDKDILHTKSFKPPSLDLHYLNVDLFPTLSFEAVEEVDISNSPILDLEDAIKCFCKSFPSLRKLRAVNYLNFRIENLSRLLEKCSQICDLELAVDISPLVPGKVSTIPSSPALAPLRLTGSFNCDQRSCVSLPYMTRRHSVHPSNIVRLELEGRGEISDSDLQNIAVSCASLCFLNINGCTSVTDAGISFVILNCLFLHSLLSCDTSFGQRSVLALCSSQGTEAEKSSRSLAHKLLTLHIGGCLGVAEISLSELLSQTHLVETICLRETQLVDDALYCFQGCSLKMLDVSETKVSGLALAHVVHQNPGLKCLKARGCKQMSLDEKIPEGREFSSSSFTSKDLYSELGKSCQLVEIAAGWGFSWFALQTLKPAIGSLRTMVVGLGASLGPDGLELLPAFCPLLETLMIYFQVISDSLVISIMQSIRKLQVLALCYCSGEISSLSFQIDMPSLRKLKLERVTAWMTNSDLVILTQSCMNLVELSLTGCKLLNPESLEIISSGWPGLISFHVEDCGQMTASGVSSLMNCRALEDLLLRHTGNGISRNIIALLISEMPMLRKISLDICDAKDSDYDIPDFYGRCFLSCVKIARCKMQRCHLDLEELDFRRTPVHKETLVLVWDSKKLVRSVVKERL